MALYCAGPNEIFYSTYVIGSDPETFNPFYYLGSTENGIKLSKIQHQRFIQEDLGGDANLDGVQTGVDYQLNGVWIEANTQGLFNLQSVQEYMTDVNTTAGYPLSELYGMLAITPKPFTTAAYQAATTYYQIYGIYGYTAPLSYIFFNTGPINNMDIELWSGIEKMPITFKCLPTHIGSAGYSFGNGVIAPATTYPNDLIWSVLPTPTYCFFS